MMSKEAMSKGDDDEAHEPEVQELLQADGSSVPLLVACLVFLAVVLAGYAVR
jgi:hypothetical protein